MPSNWETGKAILPALYGGRLEPGVGRAVRSHSPGRVPASPALSGATLGPRTGETPACNLYV